MIEERLKRLFPKEFNNFTFPDNVSDEVVEVYRALKTQKCNEEAFLPTYLENEKYDEKDCSSYSISVYSKYKHVERFTKVNKVYKYPCKIGVGKTEKGYGLISRSKSKKSSHIDWWVFKNKQKMVHELFKIYIK